MIAATHINPRKQVCFSGKRVKLEADGPPKPRGDWNVQCDLWFMVLPLDYIHTPKKKKSLYKKCGTGYVPNVNIYG